MVGWEDGANVGKTGSCLGGGLFALVGLEVDAFLKVSPARRVRERRLGLEFLVFKSQGVKQ